MVEWTGNGAYGLQMLIGLIADIHARPAALADALKQFRQRGAEQVLCAGDIAGYFDELQPCIDLLTAHQVRCVQGNHDRDFIRRHPGCSAANWLAALPLRHEMQLDGQHLLLIHDAPVERPGAGIRLLDRNGRLSEQACADWTRRLSSVKADVLIVGHSHQVFAVDLGRLRVINPGSCPFNHSAALLELPSGRVEFLSLEGQPLRHSWNFSHSLGQQRPNTGAP